MDHKTCKETHFKSFINEEWGKGEGVMHRHVWKKCGGKEGVGLA